jgi:hypothetical protein
MQSLIDGKRYTAVTPFPGVTCDALAGSSQLAALTGEFAALPGFVR